MLFLLEDACDDRKLLLFASSLKRLLFRANFKSHADADVLASIAYGKRMKVYPLAQVANPPATVFTDVKDILFDAFETDRKQRVHKPMQLLPACERLTLNQRVQGSSPCAPTHKINKLRDNVET